MISKEINVINFRVSNRDKIMGSLVFLNVLKEIHT